jgi:hypothetical protein
MTWKAMAPVVYLVEGIYEKGVKALTEELEYYSRSGKGLKLYPSGISLFLLTDWGVI